MQALGWLIAFASAAPAASPVVSVDANGAVHATMVLSIPEAEVRAKLGDPASMLQFDRTATELRSRVPDGACEVLDYHTPSTLWSVDWTLRQCPTARGYEATLVRSRFFSRYASRWTLTSEGGLVRVDYELDVGFPRIVPSGFARERLRSSVQGMFDGLAAWAASPR